MSGFAASQEVLDSTQYQVLSRYLDAKLDLDDALNAFAQPIENQYLSNSSISDVQSSLWTAWTSVVAIAKSTSTSESNRTKLAQFLVQLLYRSNVASNGETCEVDGMVVWRDLPILGWELREAWNFAATDNSDQIQKDQWTNLNTFTATLVAHLHSTAVDRPDESLFCIWTVRMAFEDQERPSDIAIAAAAAWFSCASPAIWDFSQQSKSFDGKVAAPGPAFKDQEWRGFSRARWDAWNQRLSDMKTAAVTRSNVALIQRALDAMSLAAGT